MKPNFNLENALKSSLIAGVDEAGRGPLAGPVVASAVIIDKRDDIIINDINDSKKLSKNKREQLYEYLINNFDYGIGIANIKEIDQYNILQATMLAMQRAVLSLKRQPSITLIDGNQLPKLPCKAMPVIKGDSLSLSIAAASIIAKVTRDQIMNRLSLEYPKYGWENNAGYGTKQHLIAIKTYGVTPHHRVSFKPVLKYL